MPLLQSGELSGKSREILDATQAKIRMVPNLYRALAASPAALQGYVQLAETLNAGVLPAKTRESLAVAIAEANRCEYCLSAHTAIGRMVGLTEESLHQARNGHAEDAKLEAILGLARKMVLRRGQPERGDFEAARDAGVTDAEFA
ncbi:MAG: carboxymuconolactone decarboxylase family protein, partial [Acidobacteriota bacterium]